MKEGPLGSKDASLTSPMDDFAPAFSHFDRPFFESVRSQVHYSLRFRSPHEAASENRLRFGRDVAIRNGVYNGNNPSPRRRGTETFPQMKRSIGTLLLAATAVGAF